ncbi:MAG: DNA ligase, partial [Actinocatenispora sp.]
LLELLAPLRRSRSPFDDPVPREDARDATWVEPRLVVEVAYGNRTSDGRLRFPRFRRIRDDR